MEGVNPFVMVFGVVAALALSESLYLFYTEGRGRSHRRVARDRLKRQATKIQALDDDDVASIFLESSTRGPILSLLTKLVPNRKPFDLWLYRASVPIQLEGFLGLTLLLGMLGFLGMRFASGLPPSYAFFGLGLSVLPYMYVSRKKKQRMDGFVSEFPEAIDLLCRSLKAGHPLQTGLRVVSEEVDEPVASELSQVVDEISMGLDSRLAFTNLGQRMNTQEMPFFINALLIQRETGGDLPSVLGNLARTARERLQFQVKVQAIVSQTRTSANVLAVFPLLFMGLITFASPGYLDPLYEPGLGRMVLGGAGGLTVFGWALCRRLTVVEA